MTAKRIPFDTRARHRLLAGVDALANAVKVTLGPCGRHVAFEKSHGTPRVTKDGATVAKQIWLEDHIANLGAQMVREVAAKTADDAGDGTTTATVLTQVIVSEGFRLVSAGHDPMQLKQGLERGVRAVVARLKEASKPLQSRLEIAQVATSSANGDATIGEMVATAMDKVGRNGVITVEEASGMETTVEVVEGTRFGRGYISPYFVTDAERMRSILVEPYVLFSEKKVTLADLVPILEGVVQAQKPLLIIAEDVDGEALAALVVNKLSGTLEVAAVKAPGFGDRGKEMLTDLAILTGGQVVSDGLGVKFDKLALVHLGRCQRVEIDKDTTTLVAGQGDIDAINARVELIKRRMRDSTSAHDREQSEERLAKLTGGVAVIKIGATSELEPKERKDLVDDAIHATQAAAQEGVVPGGGVALLRCQPVLDEVCADPGQTAGVQALRRALEAPLRQIAENAGVEGSTVTQRVREGKNGFGYNAGIQRYEDLLARGVIDPTKVVRVALENAVSAAGLLLTTGAVATEKPKASSKTGPSRELAHDGAY